MSVHSSNQPWQAFHVESLKVAECSPACNSGLRLVSVRAAEWSSRQEDNLWKCLLIHAWLPSSVPLRIRLQRAYGSLMSRRCVKSPIVVKVSCVFSHWWEERRKTKEGWRGRWKEWGMKDTSCTSSWKEEGGSDCYYLFSLVFLSFFWILKKLWLYLWSGSSTAVIVHLFFCNHFSTQLLKPGRLNSGATHFPIRLQAWALRFWEINVSPLFFTRDVSEMQWV